MLPALTLPAITLGLGLTFNAYFVMGNLSAAETGAATIISNPERRKRYQLSTGKSSEIFDIFYHHAASRFGPAALITSISYLATAYLRRNEIGSSHVIRLLNAAGIIALFPLPWTFIVMMPVNKRIIAKARQSQQDDANVNTKDNVDEFEQDISRWVVLNNIRFSVVGVAYFIALYAALL